MAISANKFRGIRAACCRDIYSTQRSILSNDCQIITMGSLVIGKNNFILDANRTVGKIVKHFNIR